MLLRMHILRRLPVLWTIGQPGSGSLMRRIPQHVREMRERVWKFHSPYGELTGARVCIVGLGDIGTEVARRCVGLGMTVSGVRRDTSKASELVRRIYPIADLLEAVADADHIVCVLPGGPATD